MKNIALILLFLVPGITQCQPQKTNYDAVILRNSAVSLALYKDEPDSARKALFLLNKATQIDKNYHQAFSSKIMFLHSLGLYETIVSTYDTMIHIRPEAFEQYTAAGIWREWLGDSVMASKYYEKALELSNTKQKPEDRQQSTYTTDLLMRAVTLVMIGNEMEAKQILAERYAMEKNETTREMIAFHMNKGRKDFIELVTRSYKSETSVPFKQEH